MKKTLTVRPLDERDQAPELQKRGRGWAISESRLDSIHEQARQNRREPTEAQKLLAGGQPEVWDALTRRFESRLIRTALTATHGRRMEAAQRLGIGRNTITRKIQELGLDAPDEA